MVNITANTEVFASKLREYIRLTGKGIAVAIREQAGLLAQALTKFTYPASASQGKRRVEIDIKRVYLGTSWFEEKFSFRNKKLGERVKTAVRDKDEQNVKAIFSHSSKLSLIRVEAFDPARHARLRRNGRVTVPEPRSFPLKEEGKVKGYIAAKGKNTGTAKAGWGAVAALLGKVQPAWLSKPGKGSITDKSSDEIYPRITLTTKVSYFKELDAKGNIIARALIGRAKAMISSAKMQLADAAKKSGF